MGKEETVAEVVLSQENLSLEKHTRGEAASGDREICASLLRGIRRDTVRHRREPYTYLRSGEPFAPSVAVTQQAAK
jgi:hypothetical protein